MAFDIPFTVNLDGGDASSHQLPAYDGYMALAGLSLSLSLITNYVETGKIRHRGDFYGRSALKTGPLQQGSVVAEFVAQLAQVGALGTAGISAAAGSKFLYDVVKRTLDRNLGIEPTIQTDELAFLERRRGGDLEALVAAVEPSVRQSHSIIGDGAKVLNVLGGTHKLSTYDIKTKEYVEGTYEDKTIVEKDVSVSSFNVNSGHGGVFDFDLGRVVPIQLTKDTLDRAKGVLSWGLDQYANETGKRVSLKYYSILALDDRIKKYIVVDADIPGE